jgi:hypothetical protein
MRFFFADSQDQVDPGFDFVTEEYTTGRLGQRDDVYPHEYFDEAPYDGILVSRAVVGDASLTGKYTTAQAMRFRRDGADRFLRYDPTQQNGDLMGDCGAFSYADLPEPPYQVDEMVDYYADARFTLAVSIDHVIFGYDESLDGPNLFGSMIPVEWMRRFELTLSIAEKFRERCIEVQAPFRPVGVAQGWSPQSYADSTRRLVDMGYDYVALGGLVPLKVPQIHRVVDAVRQVSPSVDLHLFGFTKADDVQDFVKYRIASIDSTSPLLRAFKDGKRNYFNGDRWYTAIRVPQVDENRHFKQAILAGHKDQRRLRTLEQHALVSLRAYDREMATLETTMEAVEAYSREFSDNPPIAAYRETLLERPWSQCPCKVCREVGIEVVTFRGSNRNRRRGFHNLWAFHRKLQSVRMVNI